MKHYFKKIVILLECLLVIFTLFGCMSKNQKEDISKDSEEITIMAPLSGIVEPGKDDEIKVEIEKLTGEKVNFIWIPKEAYKEKSTMMIASGEFPDILVVEDETEGITKGVEQGGFWNISDYLKDYKNLCGYDEKILKNSSFQDEVYGIYRYIKPIDNVIVLRKDWMQKLNLQMPNTPEEFKEILKMFKENDPDGNNIDDTYGLEIAGADDNEFNLVVDQVAAWFGAANGWKEENNKLTPSFMTNEYKSALTYIRKLYEDGLIDNKFYLKNATDAQKNFEENKYGAIISNQANALKLQGQIKKKNINSDNVLAVFAKLEENSNGKVLYNNGYSGMLMFPKKGIKTEEKLKRVLNFMDKLNSKEGYILLNHGIEEKNYRMNDGVFESIDNSNNYKLLSYSEINTNLNEETSLNIVESKFTNELKSLEDIEDSDKAIDITAPLKIKGNIQNEKRLQDVVGQLKAKFVFGQINENEYDEGIKEWLSNGGQDYINKVNNLYSNYLNKTH